MLTRPLARCAGSRFRSVTALCLLAAAFCLAQDPVQFQVPTSNSYPDGIVAGPDGNVWFTEAVGNKIARITTTGSFAEYPLAAGANPTDITVGSDGNLWFSQGSTPGKIGKITDVGNHHSVLRSDE